MAESGNDPIFSVAILTISDRSATGERPDASGPAVADALASPRFDVVRRVVVPDEMTLIVEELRSCVRDRIALVATTGGTGFSPRDVTPEATLAVIERRADGLSEAMRSASLATTRFAMLSRAVCGIAGGTLIVNLPGSPAGAAECLGVILPVLPHALKLIASGSIPDREHAAGAAGRS